jgi:tetratricopeptide (TPR) repeat protein
VIEVRYCLLVIEECIKGNLIPPKFTKILDDDGGGILLGFFLIVLFYSVAPYALTTFSPTAGEIMYFIMPIIFPASIILLAATRQSLTALNPIAIMSLISSIGAPYLLVCFLTEALFNFPDYIRYLIKDSITGFFHDAITNSLDAYFSLVVSALLGYAVYQYQKELGYVSISDDEYHLDVNAFEKKKELSTIKILAHEARYKEARDLLLSAINKDHENIELNDLLHRLLITTGDLESLSIHTLNCIEFLISKGYTGKAASYYLDTQHKIASFQLDKPDTSVKVAEALFEQGKFKETLFLLKDLHKRFPEYGFMFNAYFLVARAYAEGLHDKDNALKMLDYLSSKFLKNPRIPELESYRMRLMSL